MLSNNDDTGRVTPELIKSSEWVFSKKIIDLLSEKKLPYAKIREIAVILTDALPHLKTLAEYQDFLNYMRGRFPLLENEVTMLSQYLNVEKEKKVINHLESYFKNLAKSPNA